MVGAWIAAFSKPALNRSQVDSAGLPESRRFVSTVPVIHMLGTIFRRVGTCVDILRLTNGGAPVNQSTRVIRSFDHSFSHSTYSLRRLPPVIVIAAEGPWRASEQRCFWRYASDVGVW